MKQRKHKTYMRSMILPAAILFCSIWGCKNPVDPVPPEAEALITSFEIMGLTAPAAVTILESEITASVPYGTSTDNLVAVFTTTGTQISINDIPQVSGKTANDFSKSLVYKVTGETGIIREYKVTVSIEEPFIISFNSSHHDSGSSLQLGRGQKVSMPVTPAVDDSYWGGWFKEDSFLTEWDFALDAVSEDLVLHAKWKPATEGLQYTLINSGAEYEVTSGTIIDKATLSAVVIPDYHQGKKVTSLGNSAFSDCANLTDTDIPAGITQIGNSAFYKCTKLSDIEIPDGVTFMGTHVFTYSALTGIKIPDGVSSIGECAFYGCASLESVDIPNSVQSIGNSAFYGCTSLASISIPGSVQSIGESAFSNCSNLLGIFIGEGVYSIDRRAFGNCEKLKAINIPQSVKHIGDEAFFYCHSLASIIVPDGVQVIGKGVFAACSGLKSVGLPKELIRIMSSAFWNCSSLESITVPERVMYIENFAFESCRGLQELTILSRSAPVVGSHTFYGVVNCTLYIPENSTGYHPQISPWNGFTIVHIP